MRTLLRRNGETGPSKSGRRGFLRTCIRMATGLAALVHTPSLVFAADGEVTGTQLADWTGERFYFANTAGLEEGTVKLIGVELLDSTDGVNRFFASFRGRRRESLPEGLYAVNNWKGYPYFEVHVVPTGADSRGRMHYLATFAQLD